MFLKLFKRNSPFDYPILLVYTVLLHLVQIIRPVEVPNSVHSVLFSFLGKTTFDWIGLRSLVILSILALYIISLVFNHFIMKYNFFQDKTLLPAYIFVTLTGIFPQSILLNAGMIAFWVILFISFDILKIFDQENVVQKVFFISFFLGCFSFLFFPLGYYLFFVFLAVPFLKTPKLRELVVIPVGYLVPFYLAGLFFYFTDNLPGYFQILSDNMIFPGLHYTIDFNPAFIPLFYLLILISAAYLNFKFQAANILVRFIRYYNVLFVYFITTLFIVVFIPVDRTVTGFYLIIPLSVYLSNYFNDNSRTRFKEFAFAILVVLIAVVQIRYLYGIKV